MEGELPGSIEPGKLYVATNARRILRAGDWTWRSMRRDGLRVIYVGSRAFVFGDDILEYFRKKRAGGDQ